MMINPIAAAVLLFGRSTSAASPPSLRLRPRTASTSDAERTQLDEESKKRIISGRPLNRRTRPTWLVSVGAEGESYCGASLISERAILSAAHCFACPDYNHSDPEDMEFYSNCTQGDFFVYPGDTIILNRTNTTESDGTVVYELCKEQGGKGCANLDTHAYVINHPDFAEPFVAPDEFGNGNYTWDIWEWDYSLIILPESKPAPPELTPITLNGDPELPEDAAPLKVYGWGNNNPFNDQEDFPEVPHVVNVDYVASERCMADPFRYPEGSITETMMCAAAEGKDACNADSGGPLVMDTPDGPLEVGLVSFGFVDGTYRCSSPIFPGGYSRISAGYCWIKETACRETGDVGELCAKLDPACAGGSGNGGSQSGDRASKSGKSSRAGKSGKSSRAGTKKHSGKTSRAWTKKVKGNRLWLAGERKATLA